MQNLINQYRDGSVWVSCRMKNVLRYYDILFEFSASVQLNINIIQTVQLNSNIILTVQQNSNNILTVQQNSNNT